MKLSKISLELTNFVKTQEMVPSFFFNLDTYLKVLKEHELMRKQE